jgi:hypothetical protein
MRIIIIMHRTLGIAIRGDAPDEVELGGIRQRQNSSECVSRGRCLLCWWRGRGKISCAPELQNPQPCAHANSAVTILCSKNKITARGSKEPRVGAFSTRFLSPARLSFAKKHQSDYQNGDQQRWSPPYTALSSSTPAQMHYYVNFWPLVERTRAASTLRLTFYE